MDDSEFNSFGIATVHSNARLDARAVHLCVDECREILKSQTPVAFDRNAVDRTTRKPHHIVSIPCNEQIIKCKSELINKRFNMRRRKHSSAAQRPAIPN